MPLRMFDTQREEWVELGDPALRDEGWPAPTREQLLRHLDKFMPKGRVERRHHREAIEAVARDYGIDLYDKNDKVIAVKSRRSGEPSKTHMNKRARRQSVVETVAT
jgi:hypothetical protein